MSSSPFAPLSYPELDASNRAPAPEARARGFAAGYAAGLQRAADEHSAAERMRADEHRHALADAGSATRRALGALGNAVDRVNALALPMIEDAEQTLIEAALELAEAVLQRELAAGHVTTADALRRALAAAPLEQLVAVRLHPADAAVASARESGDRAAAIDIVADDSLAPGDAIAVLRHGWLDARLGTALARAASALTGERP